MRVLITIEAGKGGGKTHLAGALRHFFTYLYDNATELEVDIREVNPNDPERTIVGQSFMVLPHRITIPPEARSQQPVEMHEQQKQLIDLMESQAADKAVDVLASGGMQELATVSAAISLKRIADFFDGVYIENEGRAAIHVRDLR